MSYIQKLCTEGGRWQESVIGTVREQPILNKE